jgi:hypothetical protein
MGWIVTWFLSKNPDCTSLWNKGAIVNNFCYQAVISSKKIIGTSQDVFDHCEQRLTSIKSQTEGEEKTVSKRQFILVKVITKDRPETNVNTLKGTRKLHAVRSTGHAITNVFTMTGLKKNSAYTGFISKTYVCKWLFPLILCSTPICPLVYFFYLNADILWNNI